MAMTLCSNNEHKIQIFFQQIFVRFDFFPVRVVFSRFLAEPLRILSEYRSIVFPLLGYNDNGNDESNTMEASTYMQNFEINLCPLVITIHPIAFHRMLSNSSLIIVTLSIYLYLLLRFRIFFTAALLEIAIVFALQ